MTAVASITGIGFDLVEIERIEGMLTRHGDAFLRRILHPDEDAGRARRSDGSAHLAGLFAAKEAVMKALGTGLSGAGFSEIRIVHSALGAPAVSLSGTAAETARQRGVAGWHVSITHTRSTAGAVAIAFGASHGEIPTK